MDTNSKPLVLELKARYGTKTVSKGLELSITLYVPRTASLEIKTKQTIHDPAPLALSTKGLEDTGILKVTLPIESSIGTVCMLSATVARTAIFGFVFNKKGTHVPELEGDTITARDLFDNGMFSGRLREEYTKMGLLYMEVESALLPELERHEKEKQGPRGTKRTRDEIEVIEVIELSSDDDQQECPVRGFDQGYQKLPSAKASAGEQLRYHTESPRMNTGLIDIHPAKKRAASMFNAPAAFLGGSVSKSLRTTRDFAKAQDFDSFEEPVFDDAARKAQLYSNRIKAEMASADKIRSVACLPFIQMNAFPRAIAKEVDLLRMIQEISDHHEFPETVLGPCRSLLDSWKDSSGCEDNSPGRLQTQRAFDGDANECGSAAPQDPSP
ncbi:hypothetical protein MBLNU13_g10844t1 [Cladosporium sp. NU13]